MIYRRHIDDPHIHTGALAQCGGSQRLMHRTAAADETRSVVRALTQGVAFAELKREIAAVEYSGGSAHHTNVDQSSIALHDPIHDSEHLLGTGHIDDLQ